MAWRLQGLVAYLTSIPTLDWTGPGRHSPPGAGQGRARRHPSGLSSPGRQRLRRQIPSQDTDDQVITARWLQPGSPVWLGDSSGAGTKRGGTEWHITSGHARSTLNLTAPHCTPLALHSLTPSLSPAARTLPRDNGDGPSSLTRTSRIHGFGCGCLVFCSPPDPVSTLGPPSPLDAPSAAPTHPRPPPAS